MQEIWKDIKGYEGLYQVSNFGNVKSLKCDIILKPNLTRKGYLITSLCKNKIRKAYSIHRLVAKSFIPNIENKPQVNHIDGNKQNNKVTNLEWVTNSENMKHAFLTNLRNASGCKNPNSKKINQYDLSNNFIKQWSTISDIVNSQKIDWHKIRKCCRFEIESANGYIWRYADK